MDYLANDESKNRISLGQAETLKFPQLTYLDLGLSFAGSHMPESYAGDEPGRWSQLSELTQLTSLNLECWVMSGRMSDGLSNLSQLTHLDLSMAAISTQPGEFSGLTQLTYLDLSGVAFTNSVQLSDFTHLTQLTYLNAGCGWLGRQTAIYGRLDHLSNLTQLTFLDISRCDIGGSIPSSLMRLSQLKTFSIECNGLTGIVPPLPVFRIPPPAYGNPSLCSLNNGNSADRCQDDGSPNTFRCPLPPGAKENCGGFCTKGGQLYGPAPNRSRSLATVAEQE
jgi:hypothetical protein